MNKRVFQHNTLNFNKNHFQMKTTILSVLFTIAVSASAMSQKNLGVFDAVRMNDSTTLSLCLNAGLKVNTTNYSGNTLLIEASRSGSFAAAKMLVQHGAKVDVQNEMGNTALMEATLRGNEAMVALLLEAGANTTKKNIAGETALTIASGFEKTNIAALLNGNASGAKEEYATRQR